jgi:hypothetical protein
MHQSHTGEEQNGVEDLGDAKRIDHEYASVLEEDGGGLGVALARERGEWRCGGVGEVEKQGEGVEGHVLWAAGLEVVYCVLRVGALVIEKYIIS